ncbi:MAG: PEGA domain-containing protein [Deltaproteobacteria bacterium]|nr:PEGA domain-containing protein [Deltaproteobacteria bacterium]
MLKAHFRVRLCCLWLAVSVPGIHTPQALAQTAPSQSDVKSAEAHFRRGVDLFNEGNADGAMVEFRRAYQLAPRFQILYNMAQVAFELHDYALAISLFEQYLHDGGNQVSDDRSKSVKDEIAKLRERVGELRVMTNVNGATVLVDDTVVGQTPIKPQLVNIGRRRVTVTTADGRSELRVVEVAAGEQSVVNVSLRAPVPLRPALSRNAAPAAPTVRHESSGATVPWVLAATVGAGAAICSAFALRRSRELEQMRETYPLTDTSALRDKRQDVRRLAFTADGLWATSALLATVALVMTLTSAPSAGTAKTSRLSVGLAPSNIFVAGHF